ncbi:MAG: alanine racemase [Gammaproteobacteria bacterium]|nr:alanine racemase [Gammaproteobacteria bacterium]
MKRSARITIHPEALQHNLQQAKNAAPKAKANAVIKANAYGHGAVETAGILYQLADGFAVSCIPEAIELRQAHIDKPITVLQGYQNIDDLRIAENYQFRLTIHDKYQLQLLDEYPGSYLFDLNIKVDSGMHRLGLPPEDITEVYHKLKNHPQVNAEQLILMTHLSCADERDNPYTRQQLDKFNQTCKELSTPKTIANSAGILAWQNSHADWIRPGIMLYGSSPFVETHRDDLNLKAAMTLNAPVISIHNLKKGDYIGYGGTFKCSKDMKVAVIACGYADGYPRHAVSGTPVVINGQEAPLLGRVSMDMIVVDIDSFDHDYGHGNYNDKVRVGDLAELWGEQLSVDTIAQSAETIGYEILCNAGNNCTSVGT